MSRRCGIQATFGNTVKKKDLDWPEHCSKTIPDQYWVRTVQPNQNTEIGAREFHRCRISGNL